MTVLCLLCSFAILISSGCQGPGKNSNVVTATAQGGSIENGPTLTKATTGTPTEANNDASGTNKNDTQLIFSSERLPHIVKVDPKLLTYKTAVKPYKVNKDLSNVVNLSQFGKFTQKQKELLAKNSFVVVLSKEEQLFYIYENNQYMKLPSFVTTDSVLQVYHIFYDFSLRSLEAEKLLDALEKMTDSMLHKSIILYNKIQSPDVKAAALKNTAYFGVAQKALEKELPANMPDEAKRLVDAELKLIKEKAGYTKSPLFQIDLDYSQYKPRGHYTVSAELKRYFAAMMWYGQAPFSLLEKENSKKAINVEATTRALLITYALFLKSEGEQDIDRWENIYEPTKFYVGSTDDLNIFNYKDLLLKVYGQNPDIENLTKKENIDLLYQEALKLPEPKIQADLKRVSTPTGKQFRFMGQRYIADSEILQKLTDSEKRPMPKGLDIMGVFGSNRAYDLLMNQYKEKEKWPEYQTKFTQLKNRFQALPENIWSSNMYYGWLSVLKTLVNPLTGGYPSFMTNTAWKDKSLNTALGSWSELRHDTILYAKGSAAECGGGDEPPVIKSYVEPNVEVYSRLLWLTKYSRQNLTERNILPESLNYKMGSLEDLLQFLIDASIKELKNEELTKEEYYQLLIYGGTLEYLSASFAGGYKGWYEITSETDRNMANIADVHTVLNNYLEAGVGPADQIFVVVPIGGKLYLTRGAIFSYYEFVHGSRLTDEEWQKMIREKKEPAQPDWTKSYKSGVKEEIPTPKDPYQSGC